MVRNHGHGSDFFIDLDPKTLLQDMGKDILKSLTKFATLTRGTFLSKGNQNQSVILSCGYAIVCK